MNILNAKAVSVNYGDIQVLWDISFSVQSGQIVALLGTNGAGKTTALKTICGVLSGASGQIDFEGKPIGLVTFEPKQQPLTPGELAAMLLLKKNEPFRLRDVRASIGKLYATGRYSDIVVDAELSSGQVTIRFRTKGNWFVGNVSVAGVPSPPSASQLANSTNLSLGSPFYPEDLKRAAQEIAQVLASNGFFEPKIESSVTNEDRGQQADIQFSVTAGPRLH